jgi:hypothetical protein
VIFLPTAQKRQLSSANVAFPVNDLIATMLYLERWNVISVGIVPKGGFASDDGRALNCREAENSVNLGQERVRGP